MRELVETNGFEFEADDFDVHLPKYAYFRMRGRKVTPLQAFDIISKTESFAPHSNEVDYKIFQGGWLSRHFHMGIVRPDGYLGCNGLTLESAPTLKDLIQSIVTLKRSFKYLDFVFAITGWVGKPPMRRTHEEMFSHYDFGYKNFDEAIVAGVHVTGKKIRLLNAENTRAIYKKYNDLYGCVDESVFSNDYYLINDILFPEGYIEAVLKARGIADSMHEYYKKEVPYLYIKNIMELPMYYKLTCQMVITYKFLNEPERFRAWIISQFLFDAQELGYTLDDAWNLMVNSRVGKDYLSGKAEDMSANEADAELGHLYLKNSEEHIFDVKELMEEIDILIDINKSFDLEFADMFKKVKYYDFKLVTTFDGIYNIDYFSLLNGTRTIEDILPLRVGEEV